MAEFCEPAEFQIIMAKSPEDYQVCTLAGLLPKAFSPKILASGQNMESISRGTLEVEPE